MSFLDFILSLPVSDELILVTITTILIFLVGFGIYKFVKDWLPW